MQWQSQLPDQNTDWILERPPQLAVFLFAPIMLRRIGREWQILLQK